MAASVTLRRAKRVTGPLDDKVKARLCGDVELYPSNSSSGSEHHSADLSGFVRGFFFSDNEGSDSDGEAADYDEERGEVEDAAAELSEREDVGRSFYAPPAVAMIRDLVAPRTNSTAPEDGRFRRDLAASASAAAEAFAGVGTDRPAFLWAVMRALREIGYNAGICTSRWDRGGGGLVAGSYEYIDVVRSPLAADTCSQQRYIVDVDFAGEFEIARPTGEYERLVAELPRVFVGRPEELRRMLRILADAVRRSLRSRELHVPPWRKGRYLQAKWLGPYRRTVNPVPSSSPAAAATAGPRPMTPSFGPARGS